MTPTGRTSALSWTATICPTCSVGCAWKVKVTRGSMTCALSRWDRALRRMTEHC
ncbi:MAG: hypothetical protein ACODAQ_10090, partial [Phycisphaeraceae bacterium]